MKRVIASLFILFFISFGTASVNSNSDSEISLLSTPSFDPGHKQRRGAFSGKDRSPLEAYFGFNSLALKLNFFGSKHGTLVERGYMMGGMDFDSDLYAKFGVLLNPTDKNQNKSILSNFFKLHRYVMLRHALEIGYKGYFLDPEDSTSDKLNSENYGGMTFNYTIISDGTFFFDKFMWAVFDQRTARRIRYKLDLGVFLNFDKFTQHRGIGNMFTGSPSNLDIMENDSVIDDFGQSTDPEGELYNPNFGQPIEMSTYSILSPFFNFSIGFAF